MRRPSRRLTMATALLLVSTGASGTGQNALRVDGARISAAAPGEWLTHGRTYDEQRFVPLDQINKTNVNRLAPSWWAEFDTDRGQESTPLVADGVLYTSTAWSKVYAFDARTGRKLWSYDPQVPGQTALAVCCDMVNRGPALWRGRIYVGTLDGRLVAVNARTGKLEWEVQTTPPGWSYTITGAPRVIKGKVIIGNAGADYGVRGYVSAYDAETGKMDWRFFLTPNPEGKPDNAASDKVLREKAEPTWFEGAWRQTGGGATAWDALTYDEKNDLLLIGTGNGSPWNREVRSSGKGDNLFLASIVAVRPDTGEYVWHYQTAPGEQWDYTATQHIMLAELPIGGQMRRVVMQAPKNGFFYVLDAATGKLISAENYVPMDWASGVDPATGRPIEAANARYPKGSPARPAPGTFGGHNFQPMAYSPITQLVYIPTLNLRSYYSQPEDPSAFRFNPAFRNYGLGPRVDRPTTLVPLDPAATPNPDQYGELVAWDPVAQKARWRLRSPAYWRGGVLATGGGLVFHSAGRKFTAFDAASGQELWHYDTVAPAIAPAISYRIGRDQYVALMVGYGGGGGLSDPFGIPRRPGRLIVFKIGGKAKVTPFAPFVPPPPLDMAGAVPSTGSIAAGQASYVRYCQACHRTSYFLPNLSRSPAILDPETLRAVVLEGGLVPNGMPSFKGHFDEKVLEDMRAYFLSEAARAVPSKTPVEIEHP